MNCGETVPNFQLFDITGKEKKASDVCRAHLILKESISKPVLPPSLFILSQEKKKKHPGGNAPWLASHKI